MQKTVAELYNELGLLIKKGYGDRKIVVSDDNEGNGYHGMYYSPSLGEEMSEDGEIDGLYDSGETDPEKIVVIG